MPAEILKRLRVFQEVFGSRADDLLKDAKSLEDLGRHFGGGLYEREAVFLTAEEFAVSAEDVLERRTKHHLRLTQEQRSAFEAWFDAEPRTDTP